MSTGALFYFYSRRLRVQGAPEVFAGLGVSVAVALVFAVTVANGSIASSAKNVVRAVIGPANLQLHARGPDGFNEHLLARVEALPGVEHAAPLLEQTATVVGPSGRRATVDLAGTDTSLALLDGLAETLPLGALAPGGVGLSKTTAGDLALPASKIRSTHSEVLVELRGRAHRLRVSAVLGREAAGALAQAPVGVMPLIRLQQLAGLEGRVTRVFVQSRPGQQAMVRRELQALAAGKLTVSPADQDLALLDEALRPSNQASALFAGLSALLGFLFAFNAMLLTVPERRAAIADLRMDGSSRAAIVQMVLFQALCVGVIASALGLVLGDMLSTGLFHQSPGYLTKAFTLGTGTIVRARPVLLSVAGGVLATCLAALIPLQDLRRGRTVDAALSDGELAGVALTASARGWLAGLTGTLLLIASGLFVLAPSTAILACVLLAMATMLAVPLVLEGVLRLAELVTARNESLTALPLALSSLKATALRSLALAATGAVALFGSVALGSSRDDLLHGIDAYTAHYVGSADIWLVNPEDNQAIDSFSADGYAKRIGAIPGVTGVHTFQGSFLDVGDRRVWVIAWPPDVPPGLLDGQLIHGDLAGGDASVEGGRSITVSDQIAAEHHVGVGDSLTLPTPTGEVPFRIAATTTNFGWTPGAILMSTRAYQAHWSSTDPSAIGVDIAAQANTAAIRSAIEHTLGPAGGGLEAITARTRETAIDASASEGLGQLQEIAMLLTIAAILALAAAVGSSIWQQRRSLAELRLDGASRRTLQLLLLLESTLLLSAGCLTGAVAGIYGQVVINGYLKHVTGFPVAGISTGQRPIEIFAIVTLAVLVLAAAPGWVASGVPPTFALDN
jgi:putative ABC transport system permease protein